MPIRIFIADDDAVIRGLVRRVIEEHSDWQVCGEAENGYDAVQQINGQDVVFVRVAADKFAMRPVRTAPPIRTDIPILEGLKPGEQVVVRGCFILKSEMLKSAMESD